MALPTTSVQVQHAVKAEILRLAKALSAENERLRLLTKALDTEIERLRQLANDPKVPQ
jgi:hypothetical protein